MKKFRFPLEGLLRIRILKERQALLEVAAVQSRMNSFTSEIKKLHDDYAKNQAVYEQESREGFRGLNARLYNNFVKRLNDDERHYRQKISEIQPLLDEALARYRRANVQRRMVAGIKDNRWRDYLYEVNKELQAETDEINNRNLAEKRLASRSRRPQLLSELEDKLDRRDQIQQDFDEAQQIADSDAFGGFAPRGGRR